VNSTANDFCPTLAADGRTFYFVSNRTGGCGAADMYTAQRNADGSFGPVSNLGCQVNSAADEASPMPLREGGNRVLYFSSTRPGGFSAEAAGATLGDSDLYRSVWDGSIFGSAELVAGVNSASEDGQPNVRSDGLELFFFSNRSGTLGMADIYAASRQKKQRGWSEPLNLGANVNSAAAETRPSVSADGRTLYFGSTRPGGEGSSDHYMTAREKLKPKKKG
jgi:Tol biopolymer transport system component